MKLNTVNNGLMKKWEDWRKFKKWKQSGRAKSHQEDSGDDRSLGEDLPWGELEVEDVQVLPDEVLGWLLLRRANLSSSSRLRAQASVQNSLSFRAIERALRDQEEELRSSATSTTEGGGRGDGRRGSRSGPVLLAGDDGSGTGKDGSGLDATTSTTWSSQPTSLDADATGPGSFSTAACDRQEHGL